MATEQPRFSIPKQELSSFKVLARTDPETLQEMIRALAAQSPALSVDSLSAPVALASGIEQSVVNELLPLLWRWTMVQRRLDLNAEAFVAGLAAGLDALPENEWSAEDRTGWASISGLLRKLLSSDNAIASSAKASDLLLDQGLVLCSSRVITDMRTVFDDSAESIKGILSYHTLVLRCHKGSENCDLYIALDSDDLALLREQMERAEQKEALLRTTLKRAGLTVIETNARADD